MNRFMIGLALLQLSVPFIQTYAQERKIAEADLPAAVRRTIKEQSQGATAKGFSTEMEHGKKVYEAEMIVNGHTKDIQVGADGTLNEIEEEVAFDSLPNPVQQSLTKKAAGAKITKVESLTKKGKLVAYEAATQKGTKKGEVQVGPDGRELAHAE